MVVKLAITSRSWTEEISIGNGLVVPGPSSVAASRGGGREGGCKLRRSNKEVRGRRLRVA